MTRRTWFRTITGALATLATGLGLRKVEATSMEIPIPLQLPRRNIYYRGLLLSRAVWDGQRWHFEDVKPEEET